MLETGDEGVLTAFGRRMRAFRLESGRTQLQVASAAGIDVRYYSKIENGKINVTLTTLCRLAKAMKCPRLLSMPINPMQEMESDLCSAISQLSRKRDTVALQQVDRFIRHVLDFRHDEGARPCRGTALNGKGRRRQPSPVSG